MVSPGRKAWDNRTFGEFSGVKDDRGCERVFKESEYITLVQIL